MYIDLSVCTSARPWLPVSQTCMYTLMCMISYTKIRYHEEICDNPIWPPGNHIGFLEAIAQIRLLCSPSFAQGQQIGGGAQRVTSDFSP